LHDKDDMAMHRQGLVRVDPRVGLRTEDARQAIALFYALFYHKAYGTGPRE
jgi:hypothetical protein